jgi:hypothetical protein
MKEDIRSWFGNPTDVVAAHDVGEFLVQPNPFEMPIHPLMRRARSYCRANPSALGGFQKLRHTRKDWLLLGHFVFYALTRLHDQILVQDLP